MSDHNSGAEEKHQVRIHIDEKPHESPNPTIGEALYILGSVPGSHELYLEVEGNEEDQLIPNGPETIHLKQGDSFRTSARERTIIVNGKERVVTAKRLSFDDIVALAFNPVPTGPNVRFTITYRRGPRGQAEGTLVEGAIIKIKEGMIFNVTPTNKS